jgi:hypothetical protein
LQAREKFPGSIVNIIEGTEPMVRG